MMQRLNYFQQSSELTKKRSGSTRPISSDVKKVIAAFAACG